MRLYISSRDKKYRLDLGQGPGDERRKEKQEELDLLVT